MEFIRYISNEICCLLKTVYDIGLQKLQQLLHM